MVEYDVSVFNVVWVDFIFMILFFVIENKIFYFCYSSCKWMKIVKDIFCVVWSVIFFFLIYFDNIV